MPNPLPTLITGNQRKIYEAKHFLGDDLPIHQLDLEEIQSLDPVEVITHKAKTAYQQYAHPLFVLDQGIYLNLFTHALFPGPLTKQFLQAVPVEKLYAFCELHNNTNLKIYSIIGYCDQNRAMHTFYGEVPATIAPSPVGSLNKFPLDRILIPQGSHITYAEMISAQELENSSNQRCFTQFAKFLTS